jgi:hypothetical protein
MVGHPFVLMLVPLWSAFSSSSSEATIATETLPDTEFVDGIPLWAWDMHTAAGKAAITRFARENRNVSLELSRWAPEGNRTDVALIASFYVDAAPVAQRLEWKYSRLLFEAGLEADMSEAGCPKAGIGAVLDCVRSELMHLNQLRAHLIRRSRL